MNTHLKSEKQSITTKGTKHKVTRMKNHTAPVLSEQRQLIYASQTEMTDRLGFTMNAFLTANKTNIYFSFT